MSRGRRGRNALATIVDGRVGHPRARPARSSSSSTSCSKGLAVISWSFLTEDLPIIIAMPGGGIVPGDRRHAGDHRSGRPSWRCRSACSPRSTSTSTAASAGSPGFIRFMADVMTGVPSIVMGLFVDTIWVSAGCTGLSGFAGSLALGVPDAADRDPLERGDAEARPRRPAAGERRARRSPLAHDDDRRAARRAPRHRQRASMLAVARAAGETAPLLFTIGAAREGELQRVRRSRTPRCRCRSGATPTNRSRRRRTARGARRSRSS